MDRAISIKALSAEPFVVGDLTGLLVEAVAQGGSVSFLHPLASERAEAFWIKSLAAAARGERVVLGASEGGRIVGTVTLLLDFPENQPHRAEIAKLMTRVSHRSRGVARALMLEAERVALELGRTLLVLDTATEQGAAPLYESLGFCKVGVIPGYALKPHGGLVGTAIYYKELPFDSSAG